MALNRFNPEHARILRRRMWRNIARPLVFVAIGLAGMAAVLTIGSTMRDGLDLIEEARTTPGWNALHTPGFRAQLETAVHVEVLRNTPPPITLDALIGENRYPSRAAHWPGFRQAWRIDAGIDPPAVHPPRY